MLTLEPIPTLLSRLRTEVVADFNPAKPIRISRAPGRLDVMGGIADYTGSLVCEATIDCAAAVALQSREDRQIQVFSFNLFDEHQPFTFRMPMDALATVSIEKLREDLNQPGRKWAGYFVGCLFILHEKKLLDLNDPRIKGINLALFSTVPLGAGVSSSAAIEVATMSNLIDHFGLRNKVEPLTLAEMCQAVENRIVGAPCGIMDQVSSCLGEEGGLLRMICQPHTIQPTLKLPEGVRALGINSKVKHSVGGGMYGKVRCAAFMGHKIILSTMAEIGRAARKQLAGDPMNGYLANLDPEDYKQLFRPKIPETITGQDFLDRYGPTIDTATTVRPDLDYYVQRSTDHHVLEARRVRNFVMFLEQAHNATNAERKLLLDKAGHLMYASHLSYTNDAMLGADECDLLVKMVREREHAGLYGAKITGGGSGGTVAVLAETGERVDAAIDEIMTEYEKQTGRKPEAFLKSSPGAWHAGTVVV